MDTNKKTRQKRSCLWTVPTEELREIVNKAVSYSHVLRLLNYTIRGGAIRTLKQRIEAESIDDKHLASGERHIRQSPRTNVYSNDEVFVAHSTYTNRGNLKKRMRSMGVDYVCSICGSPPEWNGMPLSLQLDHINGDRDDNRIENLRFVCPNCHSQTTTYGGKSNLQYSRICECGKPMSGYKGEQSCRSCAMKKAKIDANSTRPTKDELCVLLWELPTTRIAELYNVSDKAVEKWAKKYELAKPPRGYWAKRQTKNNPS